MENSILSFFFYAFTLRILSFQFYVFLSDILKDFCLSGGSVHRSTVHEILMCELRIIGQECPKTLPL
jgi:hypothetical protein